MRRLGRRCGSTAFAAINRSFKLEVAGRSHDTLPNGNSVDDYLTTLDDAQTLVDSRPPIEMMERINGYPRVMWNVGTMSFDTYHCACDSGREGDPAAMSFYPRKHRVTI